MSDLQNYYDDFCATLEWQCRNVSTCDCKNHPRISDEEAPCALCNDTGMIVGKSCGGWISSDVDTWHQCPHHYKGQPHPEEET